MTTGKQAAEVSALYEVNYIGGHASELPFFRLDVSGDNLPARFNRVDRNGHPFMWTFEP